MRAFLDQAEMQTRDFYQQSLIEVLKRNLESWVPPKG